MAERVSPTVRRWVLANRLRALREGAGLSIEQVASHLLCHPSKVSRLETGARGATLRDVRDLCALFKVSDDEAQELMTLVKESHQKGWWHSYEQVASRADTYIGLEDSASSIEKYETIRIPGLLQTPDYARALMRGIVPSLSADGIEQFVESRKERQRLLLGDDRPSFWVILDEAALRRQVGGAEVMRGQLKHLVDCSTSGMVTLQVVPFDVGAHTGMEGSFTILKFRVDTMPDVVYLEGRSGQQFINRPAELAMFRDVLDHLRAAAEGPAAALGRLKRLIQSTPT